jgi:hypothetical protein
LWISETSPSGTVAQPNPKYMHPQIRNRLYWIIGIGLVTLALGSFLLFSAVVWEGFGRQVLSANNRWIVLVCALFLLLVAWLCFKTQVQKCLEISRIFEQSSNYEEWEVRVYCSRWNESTSWFIEHLSKDPSHYAIEPLIPFDFFIGHAHKGKVYFDKDRSPVLLDIAGHLAFIHHVKERRAGDERLYTK